MSSTRHFAPRFELLLQLIVFVVALSLRLLVLSEYHDVPYYDRPFSDSEQYQQRALEIVAGDVLGHHESFLGSPIYPYFMAAVYKPFGVHFSLLRVLQILLGSLTCVLIYRLARALYKENPYPACRRRFGGRGLWHLCVF